MKVLAVGAAGVSAGLVVVPSSAYAVAVQMLVDPCAGVAPPKLMTASP